MIPSELIGTSLCWYKTSAMREYSLERVTFNWRLLGKLSGFATMIVITPLCYWLSKKKMINWREKKKKRKKKQTCSFKIFALSPDVRTSKLGGESIEDNAGNKSFNSIANNLDSLHILSYGSRRRSFWKKKKKIMNKYWKNEFGGNETWLYSSISAPRIKCWIPVAPPITERYVMRRSSRSFGCLNTWFFFFWGEK